MRSISSIFVFNLTSLKIGSHLTRPINVNVGLREVGVLSPLLFAILFSIVWEELGDFKLLNNDLSYSFSSCSVFALAYADNLAVISPSIEFLNECLESLRVRFEPLGLKVSVEKTKCMPFFPRSGPFNRDPIFLFEGSRLQNVQEFKYLGFIFSSACNDKAHLSLAKSRVCAASISTLEIIRNLEINDPVRVKLLFLSLVASQLYRIQLLGIECCDLLESSKRIFVKRFFGLPLSMSHAFVDALIPIKPFLFACFQARVNFFNRIFDAETYSPTFDVMLLSLKYLLPRKLGWFSEFERLFVSANFAFDDNWVNDLRGIAVSFRQSVIQERINFYRNYAFYDLIGDLIVGTTLPFSLIEQVFEQEESRRRLILLMLTGSGRVVLLRNPVSSCPSGGNDFRSDHFVLCPDLPDFYGIMSDSFNAQNWDILLAHLHEILVFWRSFNNFLK